MRKIGGIVAAMLLLASCGREHVPQGLMTPDELASFSAEAMLIEGYNSAVVSFGQDSLGYRMEEAYDSLYRKYDVTPEVYDSSMAYYARRPKQMNEIAQKIVELLKPLQLEEYEPTGPERVIEYEELVVNNPQQ